MSTTPITSQIFAIRDRWHTKRHPFFRALAEGKLALKALGRYQALHYHFVAYAVRSFGLFYTRFYHLEDARKMMAENLAEEEGFKAIPQAGHEPHDHTELILRFCRATGLSDEEVRNMKMPPAWWARSLYYYNTLGTEPVGVVLAMQSTQEGQMPGLIGEVLLPPSRSITVSSAPHGRSSFLPCMIRRTLSLARRQSDLCARYLDTPELEARALKVAQEICELRWASISELYRSEVLGEKEILPPGID